MSFSSKAPRTRISSGCRCRISTSVNITDGAIRRLSVERRTQMKIFVMGLATMLVALPAMAQRGERALSCNDRNNSSSYVSHCEMREQNVGFAGRLTVDGGMNGGVSIK